MNAMRRLISQFLKKFRGRSFFPTVQIFILQKIQMDTLLCCDSKLTQKERQITDEVRRKKTQLRTICPSERQDKETMGDGTTRTCLRCS